MKILPFGAVRRSANCGRLAALGALLLLSGAVPVYADTWNVAGTGSWFTAGNWTPGGVPATNDAVDVLNGGTVQINAATNTVHLITVTGGSTVELQTGGILNIAPGFGITLGNVTTTGTLLLTGSTSIPTGAVNLNKGTIIANTSGVFAAPFTVAIIGTGNTITTGSGATLEIDNMAVTAGDVTIDGAGTVVYGGDFNFAYTNTTINSGATLQLGTGGTFGAAPNGNSLTDNGTLAISHNGVFNLSSNVSGTGGITLLAGNTANVALTGVNSYSGITNILGGKLVLNNTGGISTATTFNVGAGTTLDIQGISPTLNNLTGAGTVLIDQTDPLGALTLTLKNANFSGTITQNPVVGFVQPQNVVVSTGTVILSGTNSWTGTTTINAGGTLQFGNGGIGGNIATGAITDNGTLGINHSDNLTYASVLSGTGSLTKSGTGVLTLTNTNTYSGGTTIAGGTLSLGVSGAAGTGAITTTGSVIDYANGITVANTIIINSTTTQLQALTGVTATQAGAIFEIGGARPLEKIGAGTLILTGANTYTGGTTVTAGTLQLGTGGSLATAGALTVNGGTFDLNGKTQTVSAISGTGGTILLGSGALTTGTGNASTTFAGILSGTGSLTKLGTGTFILTGANTYTGGTSVTAGTLQLGTGGSLAATGALVVNGGTFDLNGQTQTVSALSGTGGTILLGSGALTTGTGNTSTTFAGILSGTGSLTKSGTGTFTLTGANTYTGGTTVTAGTLQLGTGGSLAATGALTVNGGTFDLNGKTQTVSALSGTGGTILLGSGALTTGGGNTSTMYAGILSGTGSLTKSGTGAFILTGANTYTGGTTITAGTLQLGNGGTAPTMSGDILNNATLAINHANGTYLFYAGAMSGTGSVNILSGILDLTGSNTYTGGTTIASGAELDIANGGTVGSITGNVANSGAVVFNRSDSYTYAGTISGSGTVGKSGGLNSTLILTGANTYTGLTTIFNGTLQIGAGGTTGSIAGNVAGGSTLAFNRSDTLTYAGVVSGSVALRQNGSGNLILTGVSTTTGATTVNAGTLSVNGSISASAVTVASGGTLGGTGTVGATTVASGGVLAPGNSIGTLTVNGNLTLASGSSTGMELSPTASDQTIVTGAASINGTLFANFSSGVYTARQYTLISSTGTLSGTYTAFNTLGAPAGFLTSLSYDTHNVFLNLTSAAVFPTISGTPNQIATGTAIQAGGAGVIYTALLNSSLANAQAAFDATSGEIHATLLSAGFENAMDVRRATMERMRAMPDTDTGTGWSLWGRIAGNWGGMDSDGNAASANRRGMNVTVGGDRRIDANWRGGLEAGYSKASLDVTARNSTADLEGGHFGAYAQGRYGAYVLRTGGSYGFGTAKTNRTIAFTGFNDAAQASQDTDTVQMFGEAGYDLSLSQFAIEPYAGIAWTRISAGAFRESGGAAALSGAARDMDNAYSTLGVQAATDYAFGSGTARPSLRIGWQHAFSNDAIARALSFTATGKGFTVLGTPLDQDRAVIDLSAALALSGNADLTLGYTGTLGAHESDHTIHLLGVLKL